MDALTLSTSNVLARVRSMRFSMRTVADCRCVSSKSNTRRLPVVKATGPCPSTKVVNMGAAVEPLKPTWGASFTAVRTMVASATLDVRRGSPKPVRAASKSCTVTRRGVATSGSLSRFT